jgi:hypothetical protein
MERLRRVGFMLVGVLLHEMILALVLLQAERDLRVLELLRVDALDINDQASVPDSEYRSLERELRDVAVHARTFSRVVVPDDAAALAQHLERLLRVVPDASVGVI